MRNEGEILNMNKKKVLFIKELVVIIAIIILSTLFVPVYYSVPILNDLDQIHHREVHFKPVWELGLMKARTLPLEPGQLPPNNNTELYRIDFDLSLYILFIFPLLLILWYKPKSYKD